MTRVHRTFRKLTGAVFLLVFPALVFGHHSRAEFSNETVEIEGVLTEVIWRNPHIALFVEVEAEDGGVETWRVEGWTRPGALEATGVTRELFEIGERLVVAGRVSRFRQALLGTNALLPNGAEAIMAPMVKARWSGPTLGVDSPPSPPLADAISDDLGFFRAWYPAGNPMMALRGFQFTEEAIASRDGWDPVDNPIVRCESPGMPVPLFHARPISFTREGENIGLHHSYLDTRRTVHMGEDMSAESQPPSRLGFSKGKWENDHTLVIETTRINYPYFHIDGTVQSEAIMSRERYSLSDDQTRLDLEVSFDDPATLAQLATAKWHFLALDEPFSVYECNVF